MEAVTPTLEVALVGRVKHEVLWRAACRHGSQSALGRALGITPTKISEWINLASVPNDRVAHSKTFQRLVLDAVSCLVEDVWPPELVEQIRSAKRKGSLRFDVTKEIPVGLLLTSGPSMALLTDGSEDPESILMDKERASLLKEAVSLLPERQATVIRMRFGLDDDEPKTYRQIAEAVGLSAGRIQQIECKGLGALLKRARKSKWLGDGEQV
jgi:RNA polymerase primary sigma factor